MAGVPQTPYKPSNRVLAWIEDRLPIGNFLSSHTSGYYAPKNFNIWYYFGSLALLVLINQILTGIFLSMNYKPGAATAFDSVEFIMRDVEWGWLIRYMHEIGASMFFIVVYLHMFRGLMYGSFKKPRELVWILGMLIYLTLMAEAFMGYVLPWGQMSFWGAKVIISLFGTIPLIGDHLVQWIMGDYIPGDATVNRFFALHVIALPLVLLLLVVLHLAALHEVGSNNPDGVEIKAKKDVNGNPLDGIPFHPYYTVKDLFGTGFFLLICAFFLFFEPTVGGIFLEPDNFIEANRLVTPEHIKPVWYFTPYYAMLRVVPSYFGTAIWGVLVMFGAIIVLFLVPWLDKSPVKSIRYRGWMTRTALALLVLCFVWLAKIGSGPGTDPSEVIIGRLLTILYYAVFVLMPIYSRIDATKPVPERVTTHD